MSKQAINITIELSSIDPIREDLVKVIEEYMTTREDGRGPTESEVIIMMLEKVVKSASRTLISRDMFDLYGHEMVDTTTDELRSKGATSQRAKWVLESDKTPLPEIWINPWSIVSVDWADKA